MAKYRVAAGIHHARGKVYKKGQVVDSEGNLAKVFPGKFTPLDTDEEQGGAPVRADGGRVEKERVAESRKATKDEPDDFKSSPKTTAHAHSTHGHTSHEHKSTSSKK